MTKGLRLGGLRSGGGLNYRAGSVAWRGLEDGPATVIRSPTRKYSGPDVMHNISRGILRRSKDFDEGFLRFLESC